MVALDIFFIKRKLLNLLTILIIGVAIMSGSCRVVFGETVPATSAEEFQALMQRVDAGELSVATFAGGCFWCTESFFLEEDGILATQVGYTDGHVENPSYEQVSGKKTGHAEALQVIYDPTKTDYQTLLGYFYESHNPTQLNRQGPDIGPQYRGAIFYHNEEQKKLAEDKVKSLEEANIYDEPIVTDIKSASTFYRAEEYHQRYYKLRGIKLEQVRKKVQSH